ncbi:MAG: EAL domain-containing protein [Ruminococcus sp.]|jgi:EAL domain-containing protein (putative c-di-GMP-specific phosphodiesterase class I)|nr:EAL domain-containing protein [Ruminococcus sp.]
MTQTQENVRQLAFGGKIYIEFQPIYSLNTKKVIGIEALARAGDTVNVIMPQELFSCSDNPSDQAEIFGICITKALESFRYQQQSESLYLNIDTALLTPDKRYASDLVKKTAEYGIAAENIVLELATARIRDNYSVMIFVEYCRKNGFLIAVDNIDGSPSSLSAIAMINPDIIKIDRSVVSEIDEDETKKTAFKTVIAAAKKIGALTIAVGTETVEEVIECILLGADYFQGFYFSKPDKINKIFSNEVRLKLEEAATRLNVNIKNNPTAESVRIETYKRIIYDLVSRLTGLSSDYYESVLESYMAQHDELECAFMMDQNGFQITKTVMGKNSESLPGFVPALLGENHGIKNYFYAVRERIEDPFISGWYTSAATGKSCKTISSKFFDHSGRMIVVSVDLKRY